MRKMWLDPSEHVAPLNSYIKYCRIYKDEGGSPTSDAYEELLCFTPEELEAHERKVWEAAQDAVNCCGTYSGCAHRYPFEDWKKEEGK